MIGLWANGGCAIYSIVQMLFMALCFGYLSNWICCQDEAEKRVLGELPCGPVRVHALHCYIYRIDVEGSNLLCISL